MRVAEELHTVSSHQRKHYISGDAEERELLPKRKCPMCGSSKTKRRGNYKNKRGACARFQCMACCKTFSQPKDIEIDGIRLSGRYRTEQITQIVGLLQKPGGTTRRISAELGVAKATVMMIRRDVISQIALYCACGKVAGHKGWCGPTIANSHNRTAWLYGALKDIGHKRVQRVQIYVPVRPRYERPDIPNERETEIQMLVNNRHILSLEAPLPGSLLGYDAASMHNFVPSDGLNPLEALIQKEEFESAEWQEQEQERLFRLEQWRRWRARQSSAFLKQLT